MDMNRATNRDANKEMIFRILGKKLKMKYETDINSIPDLDMMYANIKYSVNICCIW